MMLIMATREFESILWEGSPVAGYRRMFAGDLGAVAVPSTDRGMDIVSVKTNCAEVSAFLVYGRSSLPGKFIIDLYGVPPVFTISVAVAVFGSFGKETPFLTRRGDLPSPIRIDRHSLCPT
ncbi:uncharacterized protein EV420DRAFT_1473359 [Desarmillaria tabescens]|uniref:Uncharacterized protein n=1 Tax=Armillaria tabescens TaxID=1929756 RepID=A0AA39U985_ARMTA|nr:uncharacterized protein EV420DRAFT_1473359 [Desarmillaria tabescens]KAK0470295.1 hypothetical protein EV420DRAFT_1473359 [Desarmillaria tabescens]